MKKRGWSEQEIKELIELYNNKESFQKIATHFNCETITVVRKLQDLNLYESRGYRYSQEEDSKLIELYTKQGMNYKSIAKILNRGYSSVKERASKLGLTRKYNKIIWDEEADNRLRKLINEKLSIPEIAFNFKCDEDIIRNRCKILNLESLAKKLIYSKEELDIIIDMYSDGSTDQQIGKRLKMLPDTVKHIRRKEGIKTIRADSWTNEERQELLKMITSNKTLKEIKITLLKRPSNIYREIINLYPDYKTRPLQVKKLLYSITKRTFENCIKTKFLSAKTVCRRKNREFNITEDDVFDLFEKQAGRCFYTGVELDSQPGTNNFFSIDRVDSTIGYRKENIVLTTAEFNRLKNAFKIERIKEIAQNLLNNNTIGPEYYI